MRKALVRETAREHPIVGVLLEQGRTQTWLARRLGCSAFHLNRVLKGHHRAMPAFRAACAALLGLPESELFLGDDHGASSATPTGGVLTRAGTGVAPASYTAADQAATGGAAAG